MKKLIGISVIFLLLTGCSGQDGTGKADNNPEAKPQQSTQASPTVSPEPAADPSPSAGTEQTADVLETGKLQANFGFADAEGKQILVTGQEAGREQEFARLDQAIGNNGQVLAVKFVKWQPGNEQNNAREMAHNFANLPGYLFTVEEGAAIPDATYYMAAGAEFNLKSLLTVEPATVHEQSSVDEQVRSAVSKAKKREIRKIWKLADLSKEREVYVVQFTRLDKDMLFSFVLKEGDSLAFMDYPAVSENDEYSVWRVDDGGEVIPEMFSILFAAETANGVLLGLNWWGAEGVNSFFLQQEGDLFKEMDIQYGRYTSPL